MWKAVVASAVLIAAGGSVFARFTKVPQDRQEVAQQHVFVFRAGVVTKNGKPVK